MGLRTAVGGDQSDHSGRIEGRGVRRGEVDGGEHEGLLALRDARGLLAAQLGDDAGTHVTHVGGTLGHIAAEPLEHSGDLVAGLPDGPLRGLASGEDEALRGLGQRGIRRHLGGGLEDLLPLPRGTPCEPDQGGLHGSGRRGNPFCLDSAVRSLREGVPGGWLGDRRRHRADGADHPARTDCDTGVLSHHCHLL